MSIETKVAALSIVLPTDSWATIRPVLEGLRGQTIAQQIEIVLVAPSSAKIALPDSSEVGFAALRMVEVGSASGLAVARAVGVRAAVAPLVFIGETHSFLRPDACEKLLAAAADKRWAIVVPGFENGNPGRVFSWACFLADYARWSARLPEGEIRVFPFYNALYRRDDLLDAETHLEHALGYADDLQLSLVARKCRAYFAPGAVIEHKNLDRSAASLHEQFLAGILIGSRRSESWSWWRRLLYILGAPLIPFVLFARIWRGLHLVARAEPLPLLTIPAVFLLLCAKATGELLGYLGRATRKQELAMERYEIHKLDCLG